MEWSWCELSPDIQAVNSRLSGNCATFAHLPLAPVSSNASVIVRGGRRVCCFRRVLFAAGGVAISPGDSVVSPPPHMGWPPSSVSLGRRGDFLQLASLALEQQT